MLIDLSNVLSEPHRSVDETVPCELKIFRNGLGEYPVTESSDVHVKINYMENGKLQIEGTCKLTVEIPCDRCLDDMEIPVDTHNRLVVKFGKEYAEESDEVVVIPEEEGAINLAWFLYEFIALAVPMKHVHAPGKCNKAMSTKLKKHTAKSTDDGDDDYEEDEVEDISMDDDVSGNSDPRWDALKGLIENDNN